MESDEQEESISTSSRYSTPSLSSPFIQEIVSVDSSASANGGTSHIMEDNKSIGCNGKKRKHMVISTTTTCTTNTTTNDGSEFAQQQQTPKQKQKQSSKNDEEEEPSSSSSPSQSKSDELKYEINEQVYVHDKKQVYLAKIIKTRFKSSFIKNYKVQQILKPYWEYFVHFNGWSSRHDKWCHEEHIMKGDSDKGKELANVTKERLIKEEKERKVKKQLAIDKAERIKLNKKMKKNTNKMMNDDVNDNGNGNGNALLVRSRTFKEHCVLPFTLQTTLMDDRTKIKRVGRHVAEGYDPIYLCNNNSSSSSNSNHNNNNNINNSWTPIRMVHVLPATTSVIGILTLFFKARIKEIEADIENNTSTSTNRNGNSDNNGDNKESCRGRGVSTGDYKSTSTSNDDEIQKKKISKKYKSFCKGMIKLFDTMLPKYLLYVEERKQFEILWKGEQEKQDQKKVVDGVESTTGNKKLHSVSMAGVYSGEFLLRMLVRLPMFTTAMDEAFTTSTSTTSQSSNMGLLFSQWKTLYQHKDSNNQNQYQYVGNLISELITFIQKNKSDCLKGKYRTVNVEEYTNEEQLLIDEGNAAQIKKK